MHYVYIIQKDGSHKTVATCKTEIIAIRYAALFSSETKISSF